MFLAICSGMSKPFIEHREAERWQQCMVEVAQERIPRHGDTTWSEGVLQT